MRNLTATLAAAFVCVATPVLAAPGSVQKTPPPPVLAPATPGASPAAAPLTMEAKAGCGVALVALEVAAQKFPAMMGSVKEEDRKMMQFMMQVMGRQGQVYLDEAFAEGANRKMTPSQVYTAGINDMLANFSFDPKDEDAGAEFAAKFMSRCLMPGATPTS